MKILITGGAGFIGSNLANLLVDQSDIDQVRVIDDLSTGDRRNLEHVDVELIEESILDEDAIRTAVKGIDSIVHLGAIPSVPRSIADPVRSHHANATGTLAVLEAARRAEVNHVTVASSSSVYGSNPKLPKSETDWTLPLSPYAVSKNATEGYANAYQSSYGLKTLAFRFFNVYGPGQAANHAYAAVIPKFIDAALRGAPLPVQGDGTQSRDFTYVETVCNTLYQASKGMISNEHPLNLAFGTNTTLLELIEELEGLLGRELQKDFQEPRPGDVRASQADSTRLNETFPSITPVPLETGLQRTLEWFQRRTHRRS